MLQNLSLGVYFPGSSPLHRLRARTKLLALLWLIVFLVVANQRQGHFAPYAVTLAVLALAIALSGISPVLLWRRIWLLALFTAISVVPLLFFLPGKPLATFGPYAVSYGQARWAMLAYALALIGCLAWLARARVRRVPRRRRRWAARLTILLALGAPVLLAVYWLTRGQSAAATFPVGPAVIGDRGVWVLVSAGMILLVFYALALLLTMTTTPVALVEAIRLLLAPLRRLGAPVDDFALMMLIALRFIPTLVDEADQLMKAQIARGADVTRGSPRERLQSLATWFVPLVQATLRRAGDLATALEARGYDARGKQTLLHEGRLGVGDWLALGVVVAATLASLMW
jgi:energy-coupling factor transport system permease protein